MNGKEACIMLIAIFNETMIDWKVKLGSVASSTHNVNTGL